MVFKICEGISGSSFSVKELELCIVTRPYQDKPTPLLFQTIVWRPFDPKSSSLIQRKFGDDSLKYKVLSVSENVSSEIVAMFSQDHKVNS